MVALSNDDTIQAIETFRQSSSFTPGDAFSFQIRLSKDVSLPGRHDPAEYLDGLSVRVHGRVAVICAGNGGLCIELLSRGADDVIAFDTRNQYFNALESISGFHQDLNERSFSAVRDFPDESFGEFDQIFWAEGLEEIRDPVGPLECIIERLAPGGRLYLELWHGTHDADPQSINSWLPTEEAFEETIGRNSDRSIVAKLGGRNSKRKIYVIEKSGIRLTQEPVVSDDIDEVIAIIDDTDNLSTPKQSGSEDTVAEQLTQEKTPTPAKKRGRPRKKKTKTTSKRRTRQKKD